MRAPRLVRAFASLRVTVALMALLAGLLLLNIVIPQRAVLGEAAWSALLQRAPGWQRFGLETLDLGRLPASPVFLAVVALFFVQLALVLAQRAGPAVRRARAGPAAEAGLKAWARMDERLTAPLPAGWDVGAAARVLLGRGFRVRRVGETTLWGVKHRLAPLGFLLFHVSFFLLCAGALGLYFTRFAGSVVLVEGQAFEGRYARVLREAPLERPPAASFALAQVEAREQQGQPIQLEATLSFQQVGGRVERRARVNQPAEWGRLRVLVQEAGLAPQLWLQDAQGFTLDRVALAAAGRGQPPAEALLAQGRYVVRVDPWSASRAFPARAQLRTWPVHVTVLPAQGGRARPGAAPLFAGELRAGQAARAGDARLVLEELRCWAGLMVVSERGGALLVAGFGLGIAGLVWRLLLYRREVVLSWSHETFDLVGRSEVFSGAFRDELGRLRRALSEAGGPPAGERAHG